MRSIAISGSADNKHFEELVSIDNIQKNEALQTFDIDPVDGLTAFTRMFKYFRIEVLQNYGFSRYAGFCEFRIYGVAMY